jgi:hypothetical protein
MRLSALLSRMKCRAFAACTYTLHTAACHRQALPRVVPELCQPFCEEVIRVSAYAECVVCATQCFSANNRRWPLSKADTAGCRPLPQTYHFYVAGRHDECCRRCSLDGTALAAQVHSCTSAPGQLHNFSGIWPLSRANYRLCAWTVWQCGLSQCL